MEFGNIMQYLQIHPEAPRILLLSEIASGTFATSVYMSPYSQFTSYRISTFTRNHPWRFTRGGYWLAYKPAYEYLMKDDRQMSCFPEMAMHVSQISVVPVLKK